MDWIACEAHPIEVIPVTGVSGPREAWRVVVSSLPSANQVRAGDERSIALLVSALQQNAVMVSESVSLTLVGGDRLQFTPGLLILRADEGGRTAVGRTELTFPDRIAELSPDKIHVQHDLAADANLAFDWNVKSATDWELVVRAGDLSQLRAKGCISIDFDNPELPHLDLPFYFVGHHHE